MNAYSNFLNILTEISPNVSCNASTKGPFLIGFDSEIFDKDDTLAKSKSKILEDDVNTFAIGCGAAYFRKYILKSGMASKVYCVINADQIYEGVVFEAFNFASFYKLSNLYLVIKNPHSSKIIENIDQICSSFGHRTFTLSESIDCSEKCKQFLNAENNCSINCIILAESNINNCKNSELQPVEPAPIKLDKDILEKFHYSKLTKNTSVRKAYGSGLCELANVTGKKVIVLDADTKNSTFSIDFMNICPENFVECFIAEQSMVSIAIGIEMSSNSEYTVFCSTFGAFFLRAAHQIKLAAILGSSLNLCGSHVGVSIGQDGPSQMALEDIAMMNSLNQNLIKFNSKRNMITVFYPGDALSCERSVILSALKPGVCYIRSSRPDLPVLINKPQALNIGTFVQMNTVERIKSIIICSGTSIHHAMSIKDWLTEKSVLIINLFTVTPINEGELISICSKSKETLKKLVVIEDHYRYGGIMTAISNILLKNRIKIELVHLCVDEIPRSGKPAELEDKYLVDSNAIQKNLV
ncbi:MAG: hypothetical protein MHPSP_001691 [Paramarteilia canceri]